MKVAVKGFRATEGPAVNAKGEVFFNDGSNRLQKLGLDGQVTLFVADTKRGDGQAFGPDGRLYAVATATKQILAYDEQGKATVVADGFLGNDLVISNSGNIYVTNPTGPGQTTSRVWLIRPTGAKEVVDTGLKFCNGIALSPDQTQLYVSDMRSHSVYSYQVNPSGGLAFKERYYHLQVPDSADDSGADGMRTDRDGRLYVTTRLGIQVCDSAGRVSCILPTPNGRASNVCFGGANFDTLYVTSGDRIYSRKVKVKGANSYMPPFKPATPK